MNVLDYEMIIDFKEDGIKVKFDGEKVSELIVEPSKVIRHKHIRLISNIQELMREYIKDNKPAVTTRK
jgi:hypothetical protein